MADLTLAEGEKIRDNLAMRDDLNRKIASLESQTLAWMAEAQTLYNNVLVEDQPTIAAMRQDLINRLTAAVALP